MALSLAMTPAQTSSCSRSRAHTGASSISGSTKLHSCRSVVEPAYVHTRAPTGTSKAQRALVMLLLLLAAAYSYQQAAAHRHSHPPPL